MKIVKIKEKGKMSSDSPNTQLSSPNSLSEEQEHFNHMSPIQEVNNFNKNHANNNHISDQLQAQYQDMQQTPSQNNNKKSFCIDALLAKKDQDDIHESDRRIFINNNYKENVISRDLDRSPSDDQMSRCVVTLNLIVEEI
jgi:hypothetical protein